MEPPPPVLDYQTPARTPREPRAVDAVAAFLFMVLCWGPAAGAVNLILLDPSRARSGGLDTGTQILLAFAVPLAAGAGIVLARVRRGAGPTLRRALATSAGGMVILTLIRVLQAR